LTASPSLDQLLSEIYDRGWHLYSLHDSHDGRHDHWTCSIRLEAGPASLISYGQGPTPYIALSMAYDQIPGAVPHQLPKPATFEPALDRPAHEPADLSSILSKLLPKLKPDRRI
jgi:hypothetical protein